MVALVACSLSSCEKEEAISPVVTVTFYGTIVDAKTGEPVWNAKVTGNGGSSRYQTVTGNDGTYEFDFFFEPSDDYEPVYIKVFKTGYEEPFGGNSAYFYHTCRKAEFGKRVKVDFAIKPLK